MDEDSPLQGTLCEVLIDDGTEQNLMRFRFGLQETGRKELIV